MVSLTRRGDRDRGMSSLGHGDYARFSELVHARFGLRFTKGRCGDLERGVRQAYAASTCGSLDEYYWLLQDESKGAVERARLVNTLTVRETHFFRNAAHFDALYHHVLPQIIERRRPLRTLRIWSAGCASGEEPYSIAMMLRLLLPDVDDWAITILGTDINTECLERARQAEYGDWAFREERAKELRARFFRPRGKRYQLAPEVRDMVTLRRLNLVGDRYPTCETNTTLMDLVLCRNVTIYFSEDVTRKVVGRFYDALVDGGWLVIGHSEHTLGTYRRFQARNFSSAILYQRTGQPTVWPKDWEWLAGSPPESGQSQTASSFDTIPRPAASAEIKPEAAVGPTVRSPLIAGGPQHEQAPVERARELIEYGHSERARTLLLETIEHQADDPLTCVLLGQACANLGLWEEAETWCKRAIAIDKLALKAYYTMALVFQHQGRLDLAIDAMKKVVYIDRNNVLGHFGLADLYRSNEQLSHALKSLDNARRLLDTRYQEELLPDSGGVTVGRLRETVVRQQQRWETEAKMRG